MSRIGVEAHPGGPACAAAIFEGKELKLSWCNPQYQRLLEEPYRSDGALGLPLRHFCPVAFASKARVLADAMRRGAECCGVDRTFSVEDGITHYHWAVYGLGRESALALIEIEDPERLGSGSVGSA